MNKLSSDAGTTATIAPKNTVATTITAATTAWTLPPPLSSLPSRSFFSGAMGLSPEAANISQALRKHVKACLALGYGGSNQAIEAGVMRCVRSLRILLTPADIAALELGGIPEWITTAAVNEHFCAPRIRQLRGVPDRHVRDRACEMFVSDVKSSITEEVSPVLGPRATAVARAALYKRVSWQRWRRLTPQQQQ